MPLLVLYQNGGHLSTAYELNSIFTTASFKLLYWLECWQLFETDFHKIEEFHNKRLRRICRIFCPKSISNLVFHAKTHSEPIQTAIMVYVLISFGLGQDQSRPGKKIDLKKHSVTTMVHCQLLLTGLTMVKNSNFFITWFLIIRHQIDHEDYENRLSETDRFILMAQGAKNSKYSLNPES